MDTSSDDLDDLLGVGDEDNKSEDEEDNGIEEDRWSDVDAPAVSYGDQDEVISSEEEVSSGIQKKLVTEGKILEEIKVPDPNLHCLLCGQHGLEEGRLGALYKLGNLVVHHFCLMLSSGLHQVQLLQILDVFLTPPLKVIRVS